LNRGEKNENSQIREEKRALYSSIINIPLSNYPEDFISVFDEVLESPYISDELKDYFEKKCINKEQWTKAFMKKSFCCGTCTSSRIESKYNILKKYLNTSKRLTELFQTFKELEKQEINRFKDEISKLSINENQMIDKYDLIKILKKKYSGYCLRIVKENVLISMNYKIRKVKENLW